MIDAIKEEALIHAAVEAPREACGLAVVVSGKLCYVPCRNVSARDDAFELAPEDYANAEDLGEIVAVIHSHPNGDSNPSQADQVNCEKSGLEWHIVGLPSGHWSSIRPIGYTAPLVGRVFSHGTLDCYTLVRDYYSRVVGAELPDFYRPDNWWDAEKMNGEPLDLYMEHFEEAGFRAVDRPLRKHDVILMQIRAKRVNHAAVYLGEGVILQHLYGYLSSRDAYGGFWQKHTSHILEYTNG